MMWEPGRQHKRENTEWGSPPQAGFLSTRWVPLHTLSHNQMELTSTMLSNLRKYLEEEGQVGLFEEATLNLRYEELNWLRWFRVEH